LAIDVGQTLPELLELSDLPDRRNPLDKNCLEAGNPRDLSHRMWLHG
jgi:hypothetical protein